MWCRLISLTKKAQESTKVYFWNLLQTELECFLDLSVLENATYVRLLFLSLSRSPTVCGGCVIAFFLWWPSLSQKQPHTFRTEGKGQTRVTQGELKALLVGAGCSLAKADEYTKAFFSQFPRGEKVEKQLFSLEFSRMKGLQLCV
jgi:hypothetical protein